MPMSPSKSRLYLSSRLLHVMLVALFAGWGCSDLPDLPEWAGGEKADSQVAAPSAEKTDTGDDAKPAAPTQPAATPAASSQYPLTTVIVSKGAVVSPIDQKTLSLSFAVTGGPVSVTINEFRFFCKREYEKSFSSCPEGYKYEFGDLKSGSSYSLTVQAVSISTGAVAKSDSIAFQVK